MHNRGRLVTRQLWAGGPGSPGRPGNVNSLTAPSALLLILFALCRYPNPGTQSQSQCWWKVCARFVESECHGTQSPAHTPHSLSSLCLLCTPNTADKMLSKMLRPMSLFCVLHPVNPPNVMQQSFCGKLINFMCKQLLDFSLPCFTFPCPAV